MKKRITAAIAGRLLGKPLDDLSHAVQRDVPGSPLEKVDVSGIREIDSLIDAMRGDLDRLEQTLLFLLAHARDLHPEPLPVLLDHVLERATSR
jgi:hypothetical protein